MENLGSATLFDKILNISIKIFDHPCLKEALPYYLYNIFCSHQVFRIHFHSIQISGPKAAVGFKR